MADYPLPELPPQFNPSLPFTQVPEISTPVKLASPAAPTPQFNPDQPFEAVPDAPAISAAQFNPNESFSKVFTPVDIATKTKDELAADKEFNPTDFFANNPDVARDPAQLQKVLDAYRARRIEGIKLGETAAAAAKSALPTVGKFAKGIYQQASNLFVLTGLQDLANDILGTITGQTPQVKRELMKEGLRAGTEAQAKSVAATETSATGLADLARTGARKLFGKSPEKLTDQELLQELSADAAFQTKLRETTEGRGEFLKGIGLDADELAKQGIVLDPHAIENMSLVDPLTLIALGGVGKAGFQVVGKAGKVIATVPSVEAGIQLASKLGNAVKPALESVSAATRKAAGGSTALLGKGITFISPAAPAVGGVVGVVKGGPFGLISGVYAGERLAPKLARAGQAMQSLGKQISGKAPLSPALQSIVSGTKLAASLAVAPAKGAAIGAAITLPLAAAAEGSEQAGTILGGGLGLGAIGGAVHGTANVASELAAKTFFDPHSVKFEPVNSPDYGADAALDSAHRANLGKRSINEQGDVTTAREIFRPLGGEIYSVDKTTFANQIIEQLTEQLGRAPTPEEISSIQGKIDAQGYFDFERRTDGRKVILLNADSGALWHESGHLTYALLPDSTKEALMDSVRANYSPEQLSQFKAQYEARLGSQISEAKFLDELIAENFSAVFNNVPVTQLKAPAGFLRSLGSVLAQVGETLGADLTRGRTSPGLNVPLTQRLRAQFDKAARELLAPPETAPAAPAAQTPPGTPPNPAGPAPAAPAPPATPPARNIRVTKAQQDALAQRAAETGITEAKVLAAKDANPTVAQRVNEVSAQMEAGNPVLEIEHLGIADTGTPEAPTGRAARRGTQAAGYAELERLRVENRANAPADIVNLHQKTFVPVRWTEQGGTPTLIAMSSDKVISNLHQIARLASEKDVQSLLPYEIIEGKLTDAAWRKALADVQAYTENQANGFRGDGQRLTRPAEGEISIPAENKDYIPTQLTPEVANFANLVQGLATPETAREIAGKIPGNIKGQILAEANKRELLAPSAIKPRNIGKQAFKSFPGRALKEVNPLRNELAARGVNVRELLDVTERIRAKDIASVKPRTDLNFKAPVTDIIRGGFLPKEQSIEQIGEELRNLDVPGFQTKLKEWGKSLTLKAYEVGQNVKSLADVETLRKLHGEQRAIFQEDIAKGDLDAAGASSIKAQFFQEAIEAATGEGNKTGLIRQYVNPNYKPPFPSEGVQFLPRKRAEAELLPKYLETPEQGRISAISADFIRTKGTTPQFWLNAQTGKVLLAPEGHIEAARDLGGIPSGADAAEIYDLMEAAGWVRGVNDTLNKIYLNGTSELSRAARQTAEDLAFRADKAVTYDGETVVEKPNIPEPQFLPADKFSTQQDPIESAAIRTKKGVIIAGRWHGEALDNFVKQAREGRLFRESKEDLQRILDDLDTAYRTGHLQDGFVTRSNKFLTREEALAHAQKIGQISTESESAQTREGLEAVSFDEERQFLPKPKRKNKEFPDYLNIPEQGKLDLDVQSVIRTRGVTDNFWLNSKTGKILLAPEGHEWAASEKILTDWKPTGKDILSELYDEMNNRGWIRGVAEGYENSPIQLNGTSPLSRAAKQTLEDLAFKTGRKIDFNDRPLIEAPNIPGQEPQFLPRLNRPEVNAELDAITKGERDGQTFNWNGSVFVPPEGSKLDVVTLASKNIPLSELSGKKLDEFRKQYLDLQNIKNVKLGVFKLSGEGEPMVSLDLNVLVDQANRENTVKFAKENGQQAIFDLAKFESVDTGGSGETVLKDPEVLRRAAYRLVRGEPIEGFPTPADRELEKQAREKSAKRQSEIAATDFTKYEVPANPEPVNEKPVNTGELKEPLTVYHYSDIDNLSITEPGRMKQSVHSFWGEIPKTFFFVEGTKPGKQFEGRTQYRAVIDKSKIYDATGADPLEFFRVNRSEADAAIREAGYQGVLVPIKGGKQVVVMYDPVKVEPTTLGEGKFLPAETVGATPEQIAAAKKAWKEKKTESPFFQQWFAGSKVTTPEGQPMQLFHGTTHKFTEFDPTIANPENDFGKGIYLTTSERDATKNYAGIGPDLKNRVESLADRLQSESEETLSPAQAKELAKQQLVGPAKRILQTYAKLENPAILGGPKETYLNIEFPTDESGNFTGEPTGNLIQLLDAVNARANEFGSDVKSIRDLLGEKFDYDGEKLNKILREVAKALSEYEVTDDAGNYVTGEILRGALEDIGFDGIIDNTVMEKFPNIFIGEPEQVTHVIAFRPEQVKAVGGIPGTTKTFNPRTKDIRFLPVAEMTPKEQKAFIKDIQDSAEIKYPEAKIPQFVYNDDGTSKIVYAGQLGRQVEPYKFAETNLAQQAAKDKEGKAATQAATAALGDKGEIQPRARVRVERPSRIGPTTKGYWQTELIGGTKPAIFNSRAEAEAFIESEGFTDARIVPAESPFRQQIKFKQETSYVPEKNH